MLHRDERERRLQAIRDGLVGGESVESQTVREFIGWFNAERRGYNVRYRIRRALEDYGLRTIPDFGAAHIDARIVFALAEDESKENDLKNEDSGEAGSESVDAPTLDEPVIYVAGAAAEPAFRVSRLLAANTRPLSVAPDASLCEAVTLMLRHDYSQLPVMTSERDVKGIISWETIAPRLALKDDKPTHVREYMKGHHEVNVADSLFRVIGRIVEHSYVLVRADDRTISGIVTTTDLSVQFRQLSEPFLLLGEIENHIRKLIDGKFTVEELSSVKDDADSDRQIETVADLTFGEYLRLLESPELWAKTGIQVDRRVFVRELDKVRLIRNDVMHFDPDGITTEDQALLRHFVQFLHDVRRIGSL